VTFFLPPIRRSPGLYVKLKDLTAQTKQGSGQEDRTFRNFAFSVLSVTCSEAPANSPTYNEVQLKVI